MPEGQRYGVLRESWRSSVLEVSQSPPSSPLTYTLFCLIVLFNVGIPKAGVAFGETPMTFGYLAFLGFAAFGFIFVIKHSRISFAATANFLFGFVPIGTLAVVKLLYGGSSYGLLLYTLILLIIPAIMLLLYTPVLESLSEKEIAKPLVYCVRFTVAWGIMNFLIFAFTQRLIEIPYVTVHPLDVGEIYQKNNRRGILMKLVGTYNNGNLFGVCMLMLFPIYFYFEKSRLFLAAACMALLLTLSRTVWFGLAGLSALMVMMRLIRIGKPWIWLTGAALAAIGIALLPLMGWTPDRVVEARMGGRMVLWDQLVLTPIGAGDVKVKEVLYASLLQSFGIVGTLSAVIAFAFPVVYGLARLSELSALRRSALCGIMTYLFVSFSDAAFIYPPTIVIFMFVVTMLYRHGYANESDVPPPPAAQQRQPAPGSTISLAQASKLAG